MDGDAVSRRGRTPVARAVFALVAAVACTVAVGTAAGAGPARSEARAAAVVPALATPLHTSGTTIVDANGAAVRLTGVNWAGTEQGGRSDAVKAADACGLVWRTPADGINGVGFDSLYQSVRSWGFNVLRVPVSWNDLEPVAPRWSATLNRYTHTFNTAYLNDLKSVVTKARAAGLGVILDLHQDFWSPALHHITNWDGSAGYCEGAGMPRWLDPSIDAKATTAQDVDFRAAMNRFYRNVLDPTSTLTGTTPWQLFYSAWDWLSYTFSSRSGYADWSAVVGADLLNEPYAPYVGTSPPAGQSVLQAAGSRLRSFYTALAPAVTGSNPSWLLFFEDGTGGDYSANPALREAPAMTARPSAAGQWVYSAHLYDFAYGTFSDDVPGHDNFGITVADADLANARAWRVPFYVGEFTTFTRGIDAHLLTDADMVQTRTFLSWARTNGVSWTFWAYASTYSPMSVVDTATGAPFPLVQQALAGGL